MKFNIDSEGYIANILALNEPLCANIWFCCLRTSFVVIYMVFKLFAKESSHAARKKGYGSHNYSLNIID